MQININNILNVHGMATHYLMQLNIKNNQAKQTLKLE